MLFIEEIAMFQVRAPVAVVPSAGGRAAPGIQLCPAAVAVWREIARRSRGLEMAYFQIAHSGVTLTACSHIRGAGFNRDRAWPRRAPAGRADDRRRRPARYRVAASRCGDTGRRTRQPLPHTPPVRQRAGRRPSRPVLTP